MKNSDDQPDRQEWWEQHWQRRYQHRYGPLGMRQPWQRKRRALYRPLAGFLFFILFVLVSVGVLAFVLTRIFGGSGEITLLVWLISCGLIPTTAVLAGVLAIRSFRRVADPLAQVMAAADAVADGDLGVRVQEAGPGDVRRLAHSFNRMVSELERAEQQRQNLTADIAHELRTPIHIIQGNLEGIQDGVYEATPEQINLLLDETHQLARLVDDLRILSLVETEQFPLERKPIDLTALLTSVQTSFLGEAAASGVTIQTMLGSSPDRYEAMGDADRLAQVLNNLVVNALRYTPAGGTVTLSAGTRPGGIQIQVSDSGEGIAAEDLPFIFDRFWKGDPARQRNQNAGSGLGLAIARQLVQAQGGRISVASQPGLGTTFTIELEQAPIRSG